MHDGNYLESIGTSYRRVRVKYIPSLVVTVDEGKNWVVQMFMSSEGNEIPLQADNFAC